VAGQVRRVRPDQRTEAAVTPGMRREEAVVTDRLWSGLARTAAGTASGWHHHGDFETTFYVLSGVVRMEFGPQGGESVDVGAGDFGYISPGAVHRESNPSDGESVAVVVRAGSGAAVINVDGPEPG
jgi:uncharacterized RmlC-like cupin family protein